MIEVTGLTRRFGPAVAVEGLDLHLGPGRILALVGPNGAGKTTALRMMAGILPPSSGRVRIAGHDMWTDGLAAKQRLAWVAHNPQHYDNLTIREYLELVAALWRVDDWRPKADALAAGFDMADRLDELISVQSTGNRQKASLVGALLHDPAVLLLDEPMNGLDPFAIRALRRHMSDVARRGATVIISSHLLALVDDIATDLLIMVGGRARWQGTRDQAYSRWPGNSLEELFLQAAGR